MSDNKIKSKRFTLKIPAHILEEATTAAIQKAKQFNNPIPILENNKIIIKTGNKKKQLLLVEKTDKVLVKKKMSLL
jgi:hypothetical protein